MRFEEHKWINQLNKSNIKLFHILIEITKVSAAGGGRIDRRTTLCFRSGRLFANNVSFILGGLCEDLHLLKTLRTVIQNLPHFAIARLSVKTRLTNLVGEFLNSLEKF